VNFAWLYGLAQTELGTHEVFYNYVLKCFLLLDLKMGKLTHADVGQMDGYVRLYDTVVARE